MDAYLMSGLPALTPHDLADLPASLAGGVVAVGNFDGVHRGHAALLQATRDAASAGGVPALVLTYEPHPRTFFRPDEPVFRLTPLDAKARLLEAIGLDGMAVATFDGAFSSMSAGEFVERVLVGRLKLRAAVVGFNFHFGKGRAGTPALLVEIGARLGFPVTVFDRVFGEGGEPLSSSAIRARLADGDIVGANRMLGYRWFVSGEVVAGDRRGRELGYPTANIRLGEDCRLRHGIYAVRLRRAGGAIHAGVANYGRRPTFGGGPPILEVFLFDFSGDLYGEAVEVAFVDWIRPELAFKDAAELVAAMDGDSARARAILADSGPGTALDLALVRPA
jgi:riboflavin kinase/FMN adenylyltransferase